MPRVPLNSAVRRHPVLLHQIGPVVTAPRTINMQPVLMPCRIDVLYGYSTIRPQMACRLWG